MMETSADTYDPRVSIRGTGEAVVLVPGLDGTGELFYRQTPLLVRSYRVATYALRDGATSMDVLVNDLARVIDQVAPVERRAIIIGESFGGALALTFALTDPARVSALVVLNSFPHFGPQLRLRAAICGLKLMPWGAMHLSRRLTAFRLHSKHTHRREVRRFIDDKRDPRRIRRPLGVAQGLRCPRPSALSTNRHAVSRVRAGQSRAVRGAGPLHG